MDIKVNGVGAEYYSNILNILRNFKPFDDMTNTEANVLVFYIYKYHQLKDSIDDINLSIIFNSPQFKIEGSEFCNMQVTTFRTFSYKNRNRNLIGDDYLPVKFFRNLSNKEFNFNIKVINEEANI